MLNISIILVKVRVANILEKKYVEHPYFDNMVIY